MRRLLEHFRKTSMALASKSNRLHVVCDCDAYDEWTSKSYGADMPIVYKDNIYLSWGPEGTEPDDIPGESVHWEYICNCVEPPMLECIRENYDHWGPINYNSDKKIWWGSAVWKSGTSGAAWSDIPSRSSSWTWVCGEIPPTPTPTPTTNLTPTPTPSPTGIVVDDCNCEDFELWESRRYDARERVCWKDTTPEGLERTRIFEAYDWEGTDETDVPGISIHWREICSKPIRFFFKIVSQSRYIGFLETDVEGVCRGLFNETVELTRNASRLLYSSSGYLYPVQVGSELYINPSSDVTYQFEDDDFHIEEDGQWIWAGGFFYQLEGRTIVRSIACSAYEPVDCETTPWSGWSKCLNDKEEEVTCGGGSRFHTREIVQQPMYGGKECPELKEVEDCNTEPCPEDCEVSDWIPTETDPLGWSECSKSCDDGSGPGTQERHREIVDEGCCGGNPCPELTDIRNCNMELCPEDCVVSDWIGFGECLDKNGRVTTCGGGLRTDTRTIISDEKYGGKCPERDELIRTQPCATELCDVDCEVSGWRVTLDSDVDGWGPCSTGCGGGSQTRVRTITIPAVANGTLCPALEETRSCNQEIPCPCDAECISISLDNAPVWNGIYKRKISIPDPTKGRNQSTYREYWESDSGHILGWIPGSDTRNWSGTYVGFPSEHSMWWGGLQGISPTRSEYESNAKYCPYDTEANWFTHVTHGTPVVEVVECPTPTPTPTPIDCEVSSWYASRDEWNKTGISNQPVGTSQLGGWCKGGCGEEGTYTNYRHELSKPNALGQPCEELEWVRSCLEPCVCEDERICITGSNVGVDDNYKLSGSYTVKILKEVVDLFPDVDLWIHHGTETTNPETNTLASSGSSFHEITRNYWVGTTNGRVIYWDESAKWRVGTADDLTYVKSNLTVPNPSEDFASKEPTLKCSSDDLHTWVGVDWDIYLYSNYDDSDAEYSKVPVALSKWNNFEVEASTNEGVQIQVLSRQGTVAHSILDKRVGNKSSILFPGGSAHLAIPQIPCPPVGTLSGPPNWRCSGSYFTGGRSDYGANDPERYGKLYKSVFEVTGHDFTWEFWFNISSWSQTHNRAWAGPAGTHLVGTFTEYSHPTNTGTSDNFYILVNPTNKMQVGIRGVGGGTGQTSIEPQTWYHFAFVKKDGVNIGYLDGKKEFEFNWNGNLNMRKGKGQYIDALTFGYRVFSGRFFLDEFKYVKGKAIYDGVSANIGDSVFEPPTEFANIPPSVSTCTAPTNCVASDWNWGKCLNIEEVEVTCGTGEQRGVRTIITGETNGGSCPEREELEKTRPCATDPCPVDCVASEWNWSGICLKDQVEVTCGEAWETGTRTIVSDENLTGKCPERTELEKTRACTLEPCPDPLGPICVTNSPVEEFNGTYIWDSFVEATNRNTWKKFDLENGHKYLYFAACGTGRCRWEISNYDHPTGVLTQAAKTGQTPNWPWEASWPSENFSQMTLTPNTSCFDPLGPICVTNSQVEAFNGTYVWDGTSSTKLGQRNKWTHTDPPQGLQAIDIVFQTNDSPWGWWEFQPAGTSTYSIIASGQNVNNHEWPWEASWKAGLDLSPNTSC